MVTPHTFKASKDRSKDDIKLAVCKTFGRISLADRCLSREDLVCIDILDSHAAPGPLYKRHESLVHSLRRFEITAALMFELVGIWEVVFIVCPWQQLTIGPDYYLRLEPKISILTPPGR